MHCIRIYLDFRALWVKVVLCGTEKMKLAILDFSADCKSEQAKKKFAPFLLSMQVNDLSSLIK